MGRPRCLPQRRLGDATDDRDLRADKRARWVQPPVGEVDGRHTVLDRHALGPSCRHVPFGPAEGGEDERLLASDDVGARI